MSRYIDHAPQPGPMYWDWRCLECSEPVSDHLLLPRRLWRRLRGIKASGPWGERSAASPVSTKGGEA